MELKDFTPHYTLDKNLVRKPFVIAPLGDIQLGSDQFSENSLRDHIAWTLDEYDNVYWLGMGDYIDPSSPSTRANIASVRVYDSTKQMLDDGAKWAIERLFKLIRPTEGRWLGLLEGHHFHEFRNGITSDQVIAEGLATDFLGSCAMIDLHFPHSVASNGGKVLTTDNTRVDGRSSRTRGKLTVWAHHGEGSGRSPAAPINRLVQLAPHFHADIMLMGHMHRRAAAPISRLYKVGARVVEREIALACTGSFLRAYPRGKKAGRARRAVHEIRGGYAERRMLGPVSLQGIVVKVWPVVTNGIWTPRLRVDT